MPITSSKIKEGYSSSDDAVNYKNFSKSKNQNYGCNLQKELCIRDAINSRNENFSKEASNNRHQ